MSKSVGEQVPGVDLERLAPWFSEHVAPVDLRDESRSLSPTITVQGRPCSPPATEVGGMRLR